jgi:hypothetical protein
MRGGGGRRQRPRYAGPGHNAQPRAHEPAAPMQAPAAARAGAAVQRDAVRQYRGPLQQGP